MGGMLFWYPRPARQIRKRRAPHEDHLQRRPRGRMPRRGGTGSPSGVIIKDSQVFNIPTGFRPKAGSDGSVRKEYFSVIVISKTGVPLGTWAYATSSGKISYDRSSDAEVIMGSGFWLTS